jgi:hypothetical protein
MSAFGSLFILDAPHCRKTAMSRGCVKTADWVCSRQRPEACISGYIEGTDRAQTTLFPDRLEDWIGEDSLVRVIDLFVDEIDLLEIGFARACPAST